jgi:hypothetical protein
MALTVGVLTEGCRFRILVGVGDGFCFTHHFVFVALGITVASGSSDEVPRRATLRTIANRTHTKSRLKREMIKILCLRSSWKNSAGLRRKSESSFMVVFCKWFPATRFFDEIIVG